MSMEDKNASRSLHFVFYVFGALPIRVITENGQVKWIEGNPHVPGMEGSLCPRGAAGIAL